MPANDQPRHSRHHRQSGPPPCNLSRPDGSSSANRTGRRARVGDDALGIPPANEGRTIIYFPERDVPKVLLALFSAVSQMQSKV